MTIKKYIFNDQLQFLLPAVTQNDTEDSLAEHDNETVDGFVHEDELNEELDAARMARSEDAHVSKSAQGSSGRKTRKLDVVEKRLLEVLEQPEKKPNRNLSFFEGVLPSLNDFTEDEILEFQAGVLQLLRDIKPKRMAPQTSTVNDASFPQNSFFSTPIRAQPVDSLRHGNVLSPPVYSYSAPQLHPSSSYHSTQNLGNYHPTISSAPPAPLSAPATPLTNLSDDSIDAHSPHGTY